MKTASAQTALTPMVASSGERFAAVHAEDPTNQERVCPVARTTFPWSQSPPEMALPWAFCPSAVPGLCWAVWEKPVAGLAPFLWGAGESWPAGRHSGAWGLAGIAASARFSRHAHSLVAPSRPAHLIAADSNGRT